MRAHELFGWAFSCKSYVEQRPVGNTEIAVGLPILRGNERLLAPTLWGSNCLEIIEWIFFLLLVDLKKLSKSQYFRAIWL